MSGLPERAQGEAAIESLLAGLSEGAGRHLAEAEIDLRQMDGLLGEAIVKLTASFMALQAAAAGQRQAALALADGDDEAASRERLRLLGGMVDQHVGSAVTGLQFQDLTSQLIDRTASRIAGVRTMLAETQAALGALRAARATGVGTPAAALEEAASALGRQSAGLDAALSRSVRQTHMESGAIELF